MHFFYKTHRGERRLFVNFDYNIELIEKVRAVPGRRYSSSYNAWHFPCDRGTWYVLKGIFPTIGEMITPDFYDLKEEEVHPFAPDELIDIDKEQSKNKTKDRVIHRNTLTFIQQNAVEDLIKKLEVKRMSENTIRTYSSLFSQFLLYIKRDNLECVSTKDVEDYLLHMYHTKGISESYMNQIINAIKAYYEKVLGWPKLRFEIKRPKRPFQAIRPLTKTEVKALFDSVNNLKHKCILMLIYSAGLRISEACNLRVKDLFWERGLIHVVRAKGKRDRYTIMAEKMVPILKYYKKKYKPRYYLFEGQNPAMPYSPRSVQQFFGRAKKKSGIYPGASVHTLRHTFATHSMEQGMSIKEIQMLLGHKSIKTTSKYIYVNSKNFDGKISPFDALDIKIDT